MISFDDFQKIDLRVAKIIEAEKLPFSDKLLKLKVDIGEQQRQIIAGIGKYYQPEQLIGKEIVVVANLEPKIIKGIASEGMLLAADEQGEPVLLEPQKNVTPGAKVR